MSGRRRLLSLPLAALLVAGLVALPVLTVALHVFLPDEGAWRHIVDVLLPDYLRNTLLLVVGTALGVIALGLTTAWLVSVCRFPGRRIFEWALVLPLAFPAYVIAYTYTDLLQVSGPVQTWIRELTGWSARDYWFPPIRSLGGAVAMLSLVLYPYVYLLGRAAFVQQSSGVLEAARTLGCGPWGAFFKVALPMARPALVAGLLLALMETLADFGTVAYFGVPVFTTGIYRAWFSLGDPVSAAKLSAVLLAFVLVLVALERWNRGAMRFHQVGAPAAQHKPYQLRGWRALLAVLACMVPLGFGFLLPAARLGWLSWVAGDAQFGARYLGLLWNSVSLAAISAVVAVAAAVIVGYGLRLQPGRLMRGAHRLAGLGYAIPGSVIAVGVLIPLAAADRGLRELLASWFGIEAGLLLTGGILGLLFAYLVRFLAVSLQSVDAGLARITPAMDDAARALGDGPGHTLRRVHLPILRVNLLTAGLIVFVDVMKELPATLILRPFDFDTLAVQAYKLAADERLAEASTASLAIVVAGLIPVILLARQVSKPAKRRARSEARILMDTPATPAPTG
ncbi:iron ABC transporter permease [Thioalkalivibrio sp. XN8]|uniref:ABC transporter permease subunit n=1 Tax=Thioalkalivibrio sp. XN8 TaxID=2712863 RepID=UPI0013E9E770|nr:iron ABC transporter permease [Thioalkalivibrio sp. XN8]